MRRTLALALVVAACGGEDEPEPPICAPEPGPLPTRGRFLDPLALPLPEDCVEGGLRDLPGRWFIVAPEEIFTFSYPKYEGSCETGFRQAGREDDFDESDGRSAWQWSDGTRFFTRRWAEFQIPQAGTFEFTNAFAACLRPDGTLAAVTARFDTDRGDRFSEMTGARFGLRDEPAAAGLELVGEVGRGGPAEPDRLIAYNVVVHGSHAYVVGPNGLHVVDVTNPAAPGVVSRYTDEASGGFNDVRVVEGGGKVVAFLSPLDDAGTSVVDVTAPATPTLIQVIPEYSHSVQVVTAGAATHLYLATYTEIVPRYDVTNPAMPVRLGGATVPGEVAGVHDLTVEGDFIFANNTTAGLVAFDVSGGLGDAALLGRIDTSYSHAGDVGTLSNGRRVILHGDEGMTGTPDLGAFLRVLEGDPASPNFMTEIGRYQSRPEVGIHNIELVGDRAYLSYYQDGIRVVDLSTPEQPREVAHYNTWDPETAPGASFEGAVGVRVANGLVFAADSERGLVILRER